MSFEIKYVTLLLYETFLKYPSCLSYPPCYIYAPLGISYPPLSGVIILLYPKRLQALTKLLQDSYCCSNYYYKPFLTRIFLSWSYPHLQIGNIHRHEYKSQIESSSWRLALKNSLIFIRLSASYEIQQLLVYCSMSLLINRTSTAVQ